jgi:oligopeptide transport system permease protein
MSLVTPTRSINSIVTSASWVSLKVGVLALLVGTALGVIVGAIAGLSENLWLDNMLALVGMTSLSMPSFIFGGMLVLLFALRLKWLPAATLEGPENYILPVICLSLMPFAYSFLLIRSSVKELKDSLFVFVKRSFGLSSLRIGVLHVLRNSLIPLLSILGPIAAALITGSFAVEYIFAIPGLGKYFVTAVTNRDYTLVIGITLVYSVALIAFNLVTDMLYGVLDSRLREA